MYCIAVEIKKRSVVIYFKTVKYILYSTAIENSSL
jgi:hypothetical protein